MMEQITPHGGRNIPAWFEDVHLTITMYLTVLYRTVCVSNFTHRITPAYASVALHYVVVVDVDLWRVRHFYALCAIN